MLWESVTDSCDVLQCTRLFKNVFKIKSTPEGTTKSRLRGRRLLGMASRRLNSPETRSPLRLINKENASNLTPQKMTPLKSRLPLEDCDPNSQDSGYGASFTDIADLPKCPSAFRFTEPSGVAPKRLTLDSPIRSSPLPKRPSKLLIKKLSSGYESTEDDFQDLLDMDHFMESSALPTDMNTLLSGHIIPSPADERPMETDAATTPEFSRTKPLGVRRSISINNDRLICRTPPLSRVRSCLFRSPSASSSTSRLGFDENRHSPYPSPSSPIVRSFKRPEPPTDASPVLVKRCKKNRLDITPSPTSPALSSGSRSKHLYQRSHSEAEAHAVIKSAVHRSTTDSDLTGDFSKTCILPLAEGHHEDLKSISVDTLSALISGEFSESVRDFKIVDCRYPYEFEAGHIEGAMNLYTKEMIEEFLMTPLQQTPVIQPDCDKRSVIVFHCEFSWERGPNLSRYLRNIDRKTNKEVYPALHYPEVYLLHGGYQQFYQHQKELCSPQGYRPMTHPDHEADLRKFRSKSKSWQGNRASGLSARANLKRLGL